MYTICMNNSNKKSSSSGNVQGSAQDSNALRSNMDEGRHALGNVQQKSGSQDIQRTQQNHNKEKYIYTCANICIYIHIMLKILKYMED